MFEVPIPLEITLKHGEGSILGIAEEELKVRVEGQLVFNNIAMRLNAALKGLGLAYMPEDTVMAHIEAGRLVRVLSDWCPSFPGYHLYYPSRRQSSPAFTLFRDALRCSVD